MTKAEVKTLCEADDKLQWWAMVLFAEICEIADIEGCSDTSLLNLVKGKCKEFPRIVLMNAIEKAKATAQEVTP